MSTIVNTLHNNVLSKVLIGSIRLPLLYLATGLSLLAMSYVDDLLLLTHWQSLFDLTNQLGRILIYIGALTYLYNVISMVLKHYEHLLTDKNAVAALILSSIHKGIRIIFILVTLNVILWLFHPSQFYLLLANNIINTIIITSIGWIAIRILNTIEAVLNQYMIAGGQKDNARTKAIYTKMRIIRNIMTVVIVIVTIAAILMSFSSVRNIGISLLASAGFLTAIVGFSAQKALFSLFSGMQIAISQPIKIGDIVVIENVSGIVEEITFTYVTLKLGDRRRLIVPLTYFIEKPFENWSREADSLRSSLHLFIDYMLPIAPIRSELERILQHSTFWDGKACKLQVANLTERAVELRIQVSAANADDISDLRAEVREKLLDFIRSHYPEHFPKVRVDREAIAASTS